MRTTCVVFGNQEPSSITNGEWSGFLGSFIGGIVSGIGTLLAVYITTRQTREIQNYSINQTEIERRKKFTDEIALLVSDYVTDSDIFYKSHFNVLSLVNEFEGLSNQKIICRKESEELKKEGLGFSRQEEYTKKMQDIQDEMDDVERKISLQTKDRKIAQRCYYLLKIKLQSIEEARKLLTQIEDINNATTREFDYDGFVNDCDELLKTTKLFIDLYTKADN